MLSKSDLAALKQQGFVVVPSAITGSELIVLRAVAKRAIDLARKGKWPHVRTLPKQFPPWPEEADEIAANGIWGVQHLLHPDLPDNNVFALSYFGDVIVTPVRQVLDCEEDELVAELYNLLCRPDHDFALRWHRDDVAADATPEQEMERLTKPAWHAQWNLALWDDESLVVVPGSHRRARTEEERNVDPLENMPGQEVVRLNAGDLVFYDNNM